MFNKYYLNIANRNRPSFDQVNWWNLSPHIKLQVTPFPSEIKNYGNFTTIKRLKQIKNKERVSALIKGMKKEMTGKKYFKITFPIYLKNKEYAQLYALMISEGSYKTEFSLNVPEKEFHFLFKKTIKKLISEDAGNLIKKSYNHGILRSRAPAVIRKVVPLPPKIPTIIYKNKELSREYLKVAFEAEGSPILDQTQHKRYIKLTRYTNITHFVAQNISDKRIYLGRLKKKYPSMLKTIETQPPPILLDEHLLLKNHFNIGSKLQLEAIKKNKTDLRCGKISARWVLLIYANNIDKFIKEINFISSKKRKKTKLMKKIKGNNPQYYALDLIKTISNKNGYFYRSIFDKEMKKLGYKSPSAYLWRYCKKGLIKNVRTGYYQIIS